MAAAKVSADLYVEVQLFYARQMPLLDSRQIEAFAQTLTEDCTLEYIGAWTVKGRDNIVAETRENFPRYNGIAFRHWFDKFDIEPDGDAVTVRYYAMVSLTDTEGKVTFEPSTRVTDTLVRVDGELKTQHRLVSTDNVTDVALYWTGEPNA